MRLILGAIVLLLVSVNSLSESPDSLEREILADQIHGQSALINDQQTLEKAIKQGGSSPLMLIGEENIQLFAETAVFTEFGLASLDSRFLEGLTVTDAYRFLQQFGWEKYTPEFIDWLEVDSEADQQLLEKLQADMAGRCQPPGQPKDGSSSLGQAGDESVECYDPRCIIRNNQCRFGCNPWHGSTCNICRC